VSLADLSLSSADGSIHLHDVEVTEDEFAFLARVADRFRDEDPGGYTPALLVMRAPDVVRDPDCCDYCGRSRPAREESV
jgi:hypothetical protein